MSGLLCLDAFLVYCSSMYLIAAFKAKTWAINSYLSVNGDPTHPSVNTDAGLLYLFAPVTVPIAYIAIVISWTINFVGFIARKVGESL